MYCRNCGEQIDSNAAICVKCGFAKGTGVKYCANCGKEVLPGANVCTNCGFAIDNTPNINPETQKSKMTAGLLVDWVFIIFILDIPVRLLLKLHYQSVSVQELFGDLLKEL